MNVNLLSYGSGPAKGYTEALEHRLRETESALLRIISVVDGATLSSAFAGSMASGIVDTHPDTNADKAEMAAHWEQFPLATSGDIINWANEQQASQALLAAGAAQPTTTQSLETADTHFREQLSVGDTSMVFETAKGVATSGQTSTDSSISPGLLPQGSWEPDPRNDAFDMPEQFKEQFLW